MNMLMEMTPKTDLTGDKFASTNVRVILLEWNIRMSVKTFFAKLAENLRFQDCSSFIFVSHFFQKFAHNYKSPPQETGCN